MARHEEGKGKGKGDSQGKAGMGYQDRKLQAKERRLAKKGKAGRPGKDGAETSNAGTGSNRTLPKSTGKGFQIGPKPQKGIYTGKGR